LNFHVEDSEKFLVLPDVMLNIGTVAIRRRLTLKLGFFLLIEYSVGILWSR